MKIELKKFKDKACKAVLFVNILYLVLAIGLKVKADDLTKVPWTLRLSLIFKLMLSESETLIGQEHYRININLKINYSYMPWAGKNFKEWQTKGLDKCQTVTCTIEDFENGP